jgi:hypothetical protein
MAVVLCAPEESPKRAPSGFLGVRGKKDSAFTIEEGYDDKRDPAMGFHGMRGKKDNEDLGYNKRGPSMGFHGMRGKKDPDTQQQLLQDLLDKRTPSMGFMGMRGKKDPTDFDYFDKRAPTLGFQGMRGRRDEEGLDFVRMPGKDVDLEGDEYPRVFSDDEDIWGDEGEPLSDAEDYSKRVPASGFLAMRGKKGTYGSVERTGDLDSLLRFLGAAYQQGRDKRNGARTPGSKKAPSGFLGMRGKKDWPAEQGADICGRRQVSVYACSDTVRL